MLCYFAGFLYPSAIISLFAAGQQLAAAVWCWKTKPNQIKSNQIKSNQIK